MNNIITPDISKYRFSFLRKKIWIPRFKWIKDISESADIINSWHEDYPLRVKNTELAIVRIVSSCLKNIKNSDLKVIHASIFNNVSFAGQFRDVNVKVGNHIAPQWGKVENYMKELENKCGKNIKDIDSLLGWYSDLETIHPFQDGNGRVGGSFVAAISYILVPQNGYLTALQ